MGSDERRRFVIQRGDHKFWTGKKWSSALNDATVFASHRVAQGACNDIYTSEYGGKPTRTFRCTLEINLVGDDAAKVSREMLLRFVCDAVRIDVATADYGDGPLDDTLVQARLVLKTLREQKRKK